MKAKLWFGMVAAVSLLVSGAVNAQQQNPPYDMWCRDMATGDGIVTICKARTQQQCIDSRASPGESCYLNPRYDPRFRRK